MQAGLWRRVVAECVGTAMLVLVGAGSVVAALRAGGGEVGYASLGFISLALAIIVAVVIYGFGPVSGAHINPAVTLALAATRRFPWAKVLPYVVAPLVGAVLIIAVSGSGAVDLGLGATSLGEGVPYWQGIVAESLGTFLVLFAVMALAVDSRAPLGWAGLMIGLAVAAAILRIAPQTGGSLNPARTFGPYLALALFGGEVPWGQFLLYWVGPLVGAVVAAVLYDLVAETRRAQAPAAEESYTPNPPEEA
ncbi:aquaporin family protein [Knoellia sp. 3-2P3]|uniref:MIP/aquaporin family protein n=1 Tax=unclassified Knoellia TaxID=2618719 RepID=UPI0023DA99B5|nr:MIP/aquaporin family protein [Knoellia sp. 3-2P3]MDF2092193.1 aquaporin family protein [Knoellia sp. 3-2P3]